MSKGREKNRSDIFGGHMKRLRESSGLSQVELAKALDISQTLVSDCEGGQLPKPLVLMAIAKYFKVTIDYLVGLTDVERGPLTAGEAKLLEAYYRGDIETVNRMIAERVVQATIDNPQLLNEPGDEDSTLDKRNGQ